MKKEFRCNLKWNMVVLLFPLVTFLLLSPLEVFQGNQEEFQFGVWDFLGIFIFIAVVALGIISLLLSVLPDRIQIFCRAVIFVFSFLAYLQNLFLNRELMQRDGSRMNWDALKGYAFWNTVIWCLGAAVLFVILWFFKQKRDKIMAGVSIFFSLIELVAVISILIALPLNQDGDIYLLDGSQEMTVAKGQNIIVFILDRYGNVTFENGYEKSSKFTKAYQDFTFYENANSTYNYTFPSIPYMLTHAPVDCSLTTAEYKQMAWQSGLSGDFYEKLKAHDYTYHFYTGSDRMIFADAKDLQDDIDNVTKVSGKTKAVQKGKLAFLLFKTSLFKHAPYLLKPYLEVLNYFYDGVVTYEQEAAVEDNGDYYELLKTEGLAVNENLSNLLVITHLSGIHTPYTIDEEANKVEANETELEACQKGLNVIMEEYFSQLRELGLYDDSLIIITADHGQYVDALDPQPIYMIKRPGETHDSMEFSAAPISSEDFLPTILEFIGEDTEGYGTPISAWSEEDSRERKCCFPRDGFDVYTYVGDREELREKISGGDFERIEAGADWN